MVMKYEMQVQLVTTGKSFGMDWSDFQAAVCPVDGDICHKARKSKLWMIGSEFKVWSDDG